MDSEFNLLQNLRLTFSPPVCTLVITKILVSETKIQISSELKLQDYAFLTRFIRGILYLTYQRLHHPEIVLNLKLAKPRFRFFSLELIIGDNTLTTALEALDFWIALFQVLLANA